MRYSITVEMPFPSGLSAQNSGGWKKKAKPIADLRFMAKMICLEAMESNPWKLEAARVDYEFFVPDRRRRDEGNLIYQCKPLIDGCVDAQLILGDHWEVLSTGNVSTSVRAGNPGVRLTFTRK